jgi:hypothetical protein
MALQSQQFSSCSILFCVVRRERNLLHEFSLAVQREVRKSHEFLLIATVLLLLSFGLGFGTRKEIEEITP